jgi:peptidoglycan/xylan/chitin deacetylase (PgdA/CDA1 family)
MDLRRMSRQVAREAVGRMLAPRWVVLRGNRRRNEVALTFDDGPEPLLDGYLDVLDRFGARATFFVLGERIVVDRPGFLEILRRGHQVASHGWSHRTFPDMSRAQLDDELARTAALLPAPIGRPFVRPPRGASSLGSLARLAISGYTTVLWSLDSDDCRTDDASEVASIVGAAVAGDIVLLHEGQRWTLDALPRMLEQLTARGLRAVTLNEILA